MSDTPLCICENAQHCSSNKAVLSTFLGLCVEPAGDTDAPDLVGARNLIQGRGGVFAPPRQDLGARPKRAPGYSAELSRVGRSGPPGRRSAVRIHESMTSKRSDGAPRPKRVRLSPHRRLFVVRLQLRRLLDDPQRDSQGDTSESPGLSRTNQLKTRNNQRRPEFRRDDTIEIR